MIKIVRGNESDYKSIVASLNRKDKMEHLTCEHVLEDMNKQQLYIVKEEERNIAIFSITYDSRFNMYYLKRLTILNKANTGKNIASQIVSFAKQVTIGKLAMTPWKDNTAMRTICEKQGFTLEKQIDENYMLYTI